MIRQTLAVHLLLLLSGVVAAVVGRRESWWCTVTGHETRLNLDRLLLLLLLAVDRVPRCRDSRDLVVARRGCANLLDVVVLRLRQRLLAYQPVRCHLAFTLFFFFGRDREKSVVEW